MEFLDKSMLKSRMFARLILTKNFCACERAWVLDRFSLDAMVASYAAAYRRLLGQAELAPPDDAAVSEAGAVR